MSNYISLANPAASRRRAKAAMATARCGKCARRRVQPIIGRRVVDTVMRVRILFLAIVVLCLSMRPCTAGETSANWDVIIQRCVQLGIQPLKDSPQTQLPGFFSATVLKVIPLRDMGLFGIAVGGRIKVFQLSSSLWRIKDYTTGQSITVSFKPPDSDK